MASHKGGTVKAYRIAGKAELPEALATYPCAIVYAPRLKSAQYSASICKEIWEVRGEFYLFADTKKSNLAELTRYFRRIRDASCAAATLGGRVDHFRFAEGDPMTLVSLAYEVDGPERHGIVALWEVKEDVTAEVNISG